MSEPAEQYFESGGTRLCYFERGNPEGQPILLLHATGFHARCWDKVVEALPDGYRIIAVDHLGHGRSAKPATLSDWRKTVEPLASLVEHLDLQKVIGVGHSMGGYCLVSLAAEMTERFERLVLIDPVIMNPSMYSEPSPFHAFSVDEHPISRRRNRWASPEDMFERFAARSPYDLWQPEILRDYCKYGLLPAEDGDGFVLACPPKLEASVYIGSLGHDPHPLLDHVTMPTTVLRAASSMRGSGMDFTLSPTWEALADRLPNARDIHLPELTHFMPMQDPVRIAGFIVGSEVPVSS